VAAGTLKFSWGSHIICGCLINELNERKAHGGVGVAADAAVHHGAAIGEECGQHVLGRLRMA
jgi:hypothetical protein